MPLETLDFYDISPERGFLCRYNAFQVELMGKWAKARDVAMSLPQMMTTGQVRVLMLKRLPVLTEGDVAALSDEQTRAAMVHYSFMVSGEKMRLMLFYPHSSRALFAHWRSV